jgi:very-short-patch-repair endonuclease
MKKSHRIFNKPTLKQYRKTLREKFCKYIADFCCPAEKMIIELDGQVHGDNANIEKDIIRDHEIENLGFVILRFENKLVFEVPETVLSEIKKNFKKQD